MIHIETDDLILRNYQEHDLEDYYEYMSLEYTAKHEDFNPLTLEQCEFYIKERLQRDDYWLVELKQEKKVIGSICYGTREFETYDIAYEFNVKFEKKGYATQATRAMVDHIFNTLNGRRIVAECNEDNPNSYRLLKRLNFRREAHFIEDVTFKKDVDGKPIYINSYLYAILKKEWK